MRFVELHKVSRAQRNSADDLSDDIGEPGSAPQEPASSPVTINVDSIRCFYTRRPDLGTGTRITFKDGGGFAVSESYDEVSAMVQTH